MIFQDSLKILSMSLWGSADDRLNNYQSHSETTTLRRRLQTHLVTVLKAWWFLFLSDKCLTDRHHLLEALSGIYSVTPIPLNQALKQTEEYYGLTNKKRPRSDSWWPLEMKMGTCAVFNQHVHLQKKLPTAQSDSWNLTGQKKKKYKWEFRIIADLIPAQQYQCHIMPYMAFSSLSQLKNKPRSFQQVHLSFPNKTMPST